jgi:uncharacterized protein YfaA (DUF2138 family)
MMKSESPAEVSEPVSDPPIPILAAAGSAIGIAFAACASAAVVGVENELVPAYEAVVAETSSDSPVTYPDPDALIQNCKLSILVKEPLKLPLTHLL